MPVKSGCHFEEMRAGQGRVRAAGPGVGLVLNGERGHRFANLFFEVAAFIHIILVVVSQYY